MCNTSLLSEAVGIKPLRAGEPPVGKGSRDRAGLPILLLLLLLLLLLAILLLLLEEGILEGPGDAKGLRGLLTLVLREPPALKCTRSKWESYLQLVVVDFNLASQH